jgi:hypothetical protein
MEISATVKPNSILSIKISMNDIFGKPMSITDYEGKVQYHVTYDFDVL